MHLGPRCSRGVTDLHTYPRLGGERKCHCPRSNLPPNTRSAAWGWPGASSLGCWGGVDSNPEQSEEPAGIPPARLSFKVHPVVYNQTTDLGRLSLPCLDVSQRLLTKHLGPQHCPRPHLLTWTSCSPLRGLSTLSPARKIFVKCKALREKPQLVVFAQCPAVHMPVWPMSRHLPEVTGLGRGRKTTKQTVTWYFHSTEGQVDITSRAEMTAKGSEIMRR